MLRAPSSLENGPSNRDRKFTSRIVLLVAIFLSRPVVPSLEAADAGDAGAPFRIIVNAANQSRSLTRSEISRLFLKKIDWPSRQPVQPVDLPEDSLVRKSFSTSVVGREVSSVNSYWQFMIFSGRATPPVSVQTDDEAIKYVRLHAQAIGYVSATTPLDAGVVAIAIREDRH